MKRTNCLFLFVALFIFLQSDAQMITGVWKGKIGRQKAEVKIILNGDSLTGTSYYYESAGRYRRYSIKGYFDPETNEAVWWDDQLIEENAGSNHRSIPGGMAMLSRADFNCPGGGVMMLDGKTAKKEDDEPDGNVHLDKIKTGIFEDEWDYIIDNYLAGANDPTLIDSVAVLAYQRPSLTIEEEPIILPPVKKESAKPPPPPVVVEEKKETPVINPPTIEEKYTSRKKVFVTEIPISGDTLELRFYDNAEIDGDSISLFLNDKLLFEHVRLLGSAYTIKLALKDLNDSNELTMVAENLGSIPPNTSFMIAESGGKRYEAQLASTEGSSAMIRFIKKNPE